MTSQLDKSSREFFSVLVQMHRLPEFRVIHHASNETHLHLKSKCRHQAVPFQVLIPEFSSLIISAQTHSLVAHSEHRCAFFTSQCCALSLTLVLLTWTIWRAPTNASKWRMGFNPYPANVDNMASSYQCYQMADGI